MPIYEYQCTDCQHQFEIIQKINDTPVKQCPKCFQNNAKKLVSAAAFKLKGSGWYETDFKTKKVNPEKPSDNGASSGESKKSDNKVKSDKGADS